MILRDRNRLARLLAVSVCLSVLTACARPVDPPEAPATAEDQRKAEEAEKRQIEAEAKAKAAEDLAQKAEERAQEAARSASEANSSKWMVIAGGLVGIVMALLTGIAIGSSARKKASSTQDERK